MQTEMYFSQKRNVCLSSFEKSEPYQACFGVKTAKINQLTERNVSEIGIEPRPSVSSVPILWYGHVINISKDFLRHCPKWPDPHWGFYRSAALSEKATQRKPSGKCWHFTTRRRIIVLPSKRLHGTQA